MLPTFMQQFRWWDFVYFITKPQYEQGLPAMDNVCFEVKVC